MSAPQIAVCQSPNCGRKPEVHVIAASASQRGAACLNHVCRRCAAKLQARRGWGAEPREEVAR